MPDPTKHPEDAGSETAEATAAAFLAEVYGHCLPRARLAHLIAADRARIRAEVLEEAADMFWKRGPGLFVTRQQVIDEIRALATKGT